MIPQFPLSLVLIRDKMACGIFECDQIANSYPSNQEVHNIIIETIIITIAITNIKTIME